MPEILIKNKALEATLSEIIDAYYDLCPAQADWFEALVREESSHLVNASGLSAGGCFMTLAKLPKNLYSFIRWQVSKRCKLDDFFRDPANYRLIIKLWSNAAIRRKPKNWIQIKEPTVV